MAQFLKNAKVPLSFIPTNQLSVIFHSPRDKTFWCRLFYQWQPACKSIIGRINTESIFSLNFIFPIFFFQKRSVCSNDITNKNLNISGKKILK